MASNVFLSKPVLKTTNAKGKQSHKLVHIYSNVSFSQVSMMQALASILLIFSLHYAKTKYFLIETADNGGNNEFL